MRAGGYFGVALTAVVLFAATNIDDLVMLTVVSITSRAEGHPRRWHIWAGQYAGFAVLVAVSLAAAAGLALVPLHWLWPLGLLPLGLGLARLITTVRALRRELGVPEKEAAPIRLHAENRVLALADANRDMLLKMARVSEVEFATEQLSGSNARATANFDVAVVYERQIDVVAERERLTKELGKLEKGLAAAERQLGNDAFMAKAPAHIVDGLRKQAAETKMLHEKARAALEALPSA